MNSALHAIFWIAFCAHASNAMAETKCSKDWLVPIVYHSLDEVKARQKADLERLEKSEKNGDLKVGALNYAKTENINWNEIETQVQDAEVKNYLPAFQEIYDFLNDPKRVMKQMHAFELEVADFKKRARTDVTSKQAVTVIARKWAVRYGLDNRVLQLDDIFSDEEWFSKVIAQRSLFDDLGLLEHPDQQHGHGSSTHMIQMSIAAKEMFESNSPAFTIKGKKISFKEYLGAVALAGGKTYRLKGTSVSDQTKKPFSNLASFWEFTFDGTQANFNSPEFLHASHTLWPEIGDWR